MAIANVTEHRLRATSLLFGPLALVIILSSSLTACSTDPVHRLDTGFEQDVGVDVEDDVTDSLQLLSASPQQGGLLGGTQVTLGGSGFAQGLTVRFGDALATEVQLQSSRSAIVRSPTVDTPGTVSITLQNPDGTTATLPDAFTFIEADQVTVEFCQLQAQSPINISAGQATPDLFALVFVPGVTSGAGQGQGVEGELGFGPVGQSPRDFQFKPMSYNLDKDGLEPGDLSNDEYGASLTINEPGSYRYVARFRLESLPNMWVYCGLTGSEGGPDAIEPGRIEVTGEVAQALEFCQLQAQSPASAETGRPTEILHAIVYAPGITSGEGQGPGITGELGWGAQDADVADFSFVDMPYQRDLDGLGQGDLANDEYGVTLNIPVAGLYHYIARFRLNEGDWLYCGLDGSDGNLTPGVLEITDPAQASIGYCRTETATAITTPGETTSAITGLVFAAGITPGQGRGDDITAELLWGDPAAAPSTWTNKSTATYREDSDGLNSGDLANDRYEATITPGAEGIFAFAYRFRLEDGPWAYCSTAGNDPEDGVPAADALGTLEVVDAIVERPDTCHVQYPHIITDALTGEAITVYGRLTKVGLTDVSAQLLIGPVDASPLTNLAAFSTLDATRNPSPTGVAPDEREYEATFTPSAAGTFSLYYRFSLDAGQNWSYCDLQARQNTFDVEVGHGAALIVSALPPDLVQYCRVWQTTIDATTADDPPLLTVEVFEAGLTNTGNGDNATLLEVNVGYGALTANPALGNAYTWKADPMPFKSLAPGNVNNYEYESGLYLDTDKPAPGTYAAAVRIRKTGESAWVYCHTDNNTMDFNINSATRLNLTTP